MSTNDSPPANRRARSAVGALAALLIPLGLALPSPAFADDPKPHVTPNFDHVEPTVLDEMQAQAKLAPASNVLSEAGLEKASGFAGVAYRGAGITLYYKGDLTPKMTEALASARKFGSVTVVPAAHSFAELQAAANVISANGASVSSEIQAVAVEPDGSGLTVQAAPAATVAARSRARTAKGLPPVPQAREVVAASGVSYPVKYTLGEAPIESMASRYDDYAQWNGGSRWETWRNGVSRGGYCTTGFGVRNADGNRYILTAAHCASPGDSAKQGHPGHNSLETMGPVYLESRGSDLLIIRTESSPLIFEGSTLNPTSRVVRGFNHWGAGRLVCQSGVTTAMETSAAVCNLRQVRSTNITFTKPDDQGNNNLVIQGTIETNKVGGGVAVRGGDSGGPVYSYSGSEARAEGIVSAGSGSDMFYQDWADVTRVWKLTPINN
ncbi:trypsin-like serine protease [Paractinoplanes hotanensis]|uniref:S1 family peptidase n=1 Tax=Paractinoplanes hotanensis TaxID=2906497 RepID=A0ABT0Y3S8_9ACTN|nr:trypsin-like serine protease [Actinoplanes hotanensis]MCM4080706.1 S1 family peptidase [Actinoplanes hotanensis]